MFSFKNSNLSDKIKKIVPRVVMSIFIAAVVGLFLFNLTALVCIVIKNTKGYCNNFMTRVIEIELRSIREARYLWDN